MKLRTGFGFDVHQLKKGRPCWLGGVLIPSEVGPLGHSDADVLLHAICDALLGAAGLRDIGFYFPDTSSEFKDADSKLLLQKVFSLVKEKGYLINNIDCTLVAETPKIKLHVPAMKLKIAELLDLTGDDISIKATTNETMGFIGRAEGIVAYAVTLIQKP